MLALRCCCGLQGRSKEIPLRQAPQRRELCRGGGWGTGGAFLSSSILSQPALFNLVSLAWQRAPKATRWRPAPSQPGPLRPQEPVPSVLGLDAELRRGFGCAR